MGLSGSGNPSCRLNPCPDARRGGGSSMWKKVKVAMGLNHCVFEPRTLDEEAIPTSDSFKALPASSSLSVDSSFRLSKSGSRSYKKTCAICLGNMKAGHGALFTAECSHAFHFNCIASNVKHGNRVCPICRSKWKEVPFLDPPPSDFLHDRARVNPVNWPHDDGTITILRRLRTDLSNRQHHGSSLPNFSERNVYDDDEPLVVLTEAVMGSEYKTSRTVDIKAYPEFSALPKMVSEENFSILIHLKASFGNENPSFKVCQPSRASADLVTVLDISGSMAGTKLALLKQAMGFVIHNLGPSDRLSVIAFSSTARRLFPLRRMTELGKRHALQSVNSLISGGGTNIAEGLRKGAMVIEKRKEKNPVCSIIILSDGQDTYLASSRLPDYQALVPSSIRRDTGHHVPIHAFGFGADHDSVAMHSISETSGGTFSFIESECAIQDSFAQCIGGLLSVVAQELVVEVECLHPGVHLAAINSSSYASRVIDGMKGLINVGDLYADEERDFLVSIGIPRVVEDEIVLLKVGCSYQDPLSKETINLFSENVRLQRPNSTSESAMMSIEVDREKNRVWAAEAMSEARVAAERGALSEAVSVLEARRVILSQSLAGRSGDPMCVSLNAEMQEMQERMESRQRYEESGRAYVLSGLSSHSWQRATARGGSTDSTSLVHSYRTPSMVDMLQRSQTFSSTPRPSGRPAGSFQVKANPR